MTNVELKFFESATHFFTRRKKTDWTEVRNMAAIATMQGLISSGEIIPGHTEPKVVAKEIVKFADALVEELQKADK